MDGLGGTLGPWLSVYGPLILMHFYSAKIPVQNRVTKIPCNGIGIHDQQISHRFGTGPTGLVIVTALQRTRLLRQVSRPPAPFGTVPGLLEFRKTTVSHAVAT